jgi:hypothetical protein
MGAEYSANAAQTVPAGGSVIFTESPVPCNRGLVYHRDGSGIFRLANRFFRQNIQSCWRRNSNYQVAFHANIAIPEGQTAPDEGIQLSIAIDGEVDPSSTMISDVTVVGDFDNVGADVIVQVPYLCGCSAVSVRNTSTIPVIVQNANLVING